MQPLEHNNGMLRLLYIKDLILTLEGKLLLWIWRII